MSLFGNSKPKVKSDEEDQPPPMNGSITRTQFAQSVQAQNQTPANDAEEAKTDGPHLFAGLAQIFPQKTSSTSLFNNLSNSPSREQAAVTKTEATSLLGGGSGQTGGGGSLFGNKFAQPEPATGGGLFGGGGGQTGGGGSLFGNKFAQPEPATGGGLFGGGGQGGGLFGGGGGQTGGAGGLFGNRSPATQAQVIPTGGILNVHELTGNVPYNPNPTGVAGPKQGTVNLDQRFGRSPDNYEIYSITCASNADKNKSIDELRAEDYELIRSRELPDNLQIKLLENRENLEKSLGYTLPVPTATSNKGKGYTKVFKSQTRNTSMKSTFLSKKYADVIFKVENEEIPAHRNVLGVCSSHFDDLFAKHESNTFPLVIEIPNAKPKAFKSIVEFLYCGEVNLNEELAAELLNLCPRFDVKDLAEGCEDFLTKMVNVENYLKVLDISERVGSKALRKKVFTFMIRNMKAISKTDTFEELPRPLLMELLDNAVSA